MLYILVGSTTKTNLNLFILGLGTSFTPINDLTKKKRMIICGIRKPRKLKARLYAAHIIELNEYLSIFPGEKASSNFFERELNEIILNSITNGWSRQAYVQGFDCVYITLKIYKYI